MAFQLQEKGWRTLLIQESIGAGDEDTCRRCGFKSSSYLLMGSPCERSRSETPTYRLGMSAVTGAVPTPRSLGGFSEGRSWLLGGC